MSSKKAMSAIEPALISCTFLLSIGIVQTLFESFVYLCENSCQNSGTQSYVGYQNAGFRDNGFRMREEASVRDVRNFDRMSAGDQVGCRDDDDDQKCRKQRSFDAFGTVDHTPNGRVGHSGCHTS